jgi:hypothetical protein
MAKLTYRELCDAVELLAQDYPEGVTAAQVWENFFKEQCSVGNVRASMVQLSRQEYLLRNLKRPNDTVRGTFFYKQGKKYQRPNTLPRVPAALPVAPIPPLKNMDLKELRGILDKTIDALETIQDQVQPLLAKLLDLARDCDKLEQVRDIITGMKALVV